MTRAQKPPFCETRPAVTLVDWVTVNPLAGWTQQFGTASLVPVGEEPEGYVPGGGRCIKLMQERSASPTGPRVGRTLSSSFDLVDETTVIQCPVYFPLPFDSPTYAGLRLDIGSGGGLTNSYNKTHYPSGSDARQGWTLYSYPLRTSVLAGTISMAKVGSPAIGSMNYLRLILENTTYSAAQADEIYIGPITARRRQRTLVTISIDDGNLSVYDNGGLSMLTEMDSRGLVGNVFIYTDPISDVAGVKMSWAQIRELNQTYGWTVGAHSKTHTNFLSGGLTEAEIKEEINGSIDALRAQGFSVRFFAWPGGAYNEIAKAACRAKGIRLCYDIGSVISYAPWAWGSGDYGCEYRFAAENTAGATTGTTGAIAFLDEAIKVGGNFHIYLHDLTSGASGTNSTNITEFRTMLDAIQLRARQGLCDVVTLDEFYDRHMRGRALSTT